METRVLPFYVVCDESYSMVDHLGKVNALLRSFHHAARDDPFVAKLIRFSLIGFSERARVITPLAELPRQAPAIEPAGEAETSFGAAFSAVRAMTFPWTQITLSTFTVSAALNASEFGVKTHCVMP